MPGTKDVNWLPTQYFLLNMSFDILEFFLRGESKQKSVIVKNIMNATKMKKLTRNGSQQNICQ